MPLPTEVGSKSLYRPSICVGIYVGPMCLPLTFSYSTMCVHVHTSSSHPTHDGSSLLSSPLSPFITHNLFTPNSHLFTNSSHRRPLPTTFTDSGLLSCFILFKFFSLSFNFYIARSTILTSCLCDETRSC